MATTILTSLVFIFALACGQQRASDPKIVNGLDAAHDFPAVVKVTQGGRMCTATFVSSTTAITAAHCFYRSRVLPTINGHKAKSFILHPDYKETGNRDGVDIAIVIFDKPVAPATMELLDRDPINGEDFTLVGFGRNELYEDGNGGAGVKRKGTNRIERIRNGEIEYLGRDRNEEPPDGKFVLAGSGDSGGPMIIDGKIAGICAKIQVLRRGRHRVGFHSNLRTFSNVNFLLETKNQGADIEVPEL